MVNQLLDQGATVARGAAAFDSGGVHFATGAALVDGTSVPPGDDRRGRGQWQTPVYGLGSYPVSHYALVDAEDRRLHRRRRRCRRTRRSTEPATGSARRRRTARRSTRLTQKEKIPTSQIGQLTSTDLANGVLVSGGYTALINAGLDDLGDDAGRHGRHSGAALQAFINAGGIYVGTNAGGATSLRNAGVTTVNTNTISGISTPGSTFDATWNTSESGRLGLRRRRLDLPRGEQQSGVRPGDARGNGGTIPAATAVATYAPAGDCGGPAGFGNCYGYQINANANLPGRPAVIDQPFGAGHAIMLGFDAWYRAWTTQDERLVLNGDPLPARAGDPGDLTNRRAVSPSSRRGHRVGGASRGSSGRPCRVARRLEALVGGARLAQREDRVDHGLRPTGDDEVEGGFEIGARAHRRAVDRQLLPPDPVQARGRVRPGGRAADADRERRDARPRASRPGVGTDGLDDDVDAAVRQLLDARSDVGVAWLTVASAPSSTACVSLSSDDDVTTARAPSA